MMQAIVTRYLPATNKTGSRIIATTGSGIRRIVRYQSALNTEDNHAHAACLLAEKLDWKGSWYGGSAPNGGYCFVCVPQGLQGLQGSDFEVK